MESEFRSMAEQRRHEWLTQGKVPKVDKPIVVEARPPKRNWAITINLSNATVEERDYFCDFLEPILLGYDKVNPGHDIDMAAGPMEE